MERAEWVLSFDLATRTGWAMGEPGRAVPMSGAVTLQKPKDDFGTMEQNIGALFVRLFSERTPSIVVWETPMTPEGWYRICQQQGRMQNGASLIIQNVLAGILRRECGRKEIPFVEVARQTVLKHYTGHARWGGRDPGKAAALRRAAIVGHMPHGSKDDDRADAIATWSWACGKYGGATPSEIIPFEQPAMKHQKGSVLDE